MHTVPIFLIPIFLIPICLFQDIKKGSSDLPGDEGLDDETLDQGMEDLIGTDLMNIVRWRHQHPEDDEDTDQTIEQNAVPKDGEQSQSELPPPEFKPTAQQLLSTTATPILKDNVDIDSPIDDPKGTIWTSPHTAESLKSVSYKML